MRRIEGFTLIELVVVIAILAILAATALPRFIDLQAEARVAATQGVAGALSSGSAINYAARVAGNVAALSATTCTNAALGALLTGGVMPNDYAISGSVGAPPTQGTSFTCTVTHSAGGTATATIISVT